MEEPEGEPLIGSPLSRLNVSLCGCLLVTFPISWAQSSQPAETPVLCKLTVWIPKSCPLSRARFREQRDVKEYMKGEAHARLMPLLFTEAVRLGMAGNL